MRRRDFPRITTGAARLPAAMDDVIYAPTGFFKGDQAWRKNLTGIVKAPFPVFWDVSKT
jgi:peptide/nickel transport system substrate-binding protein